MPLGERDAKVPCEHLPLLRVSRGTQIFCRMKKAICKGW